MSSLESTKINFTFAELQYKLKRLQYMQQNMHDLQEKGFKFNQRHINAIKSSKSFPALTEFECARIIEGARIAAQAACETVGIFSDEIDISLIFSQATLSTDLSMEMIKFYDEFHYEEINTTEDFYDFETLVDNAVTWRYKSLHFLEEPSDTVEFSRCDSKGNHLEKFPKSRLLWAIQEDDDRVSTDRTMRFRSKKKNTEYNVEWDDDGSPAFTPNGINRGNVVVLIIDTQIIIGQVIKFRYIANLQKN